MAEQPKKTAKRRVKNPETFRERAVKAATESDKPKKTAKVKSGASKITRPFRYAVRQIKRFFGHKAFNWLRKPMRLLSKILLVDYIAKSWQELKLVTWPTWRESVRLTSAVLVFAIIFGATVAVVDYGLDKLFKDILLK